MCLGTEHKRGATLSVLEAEPLYETLNEQVVEVGVLKKENTQKRLTSLAGREEKVPPL